MRPTTKQEQATVVVRNPDGSLAFYASTECETWLLENGKARRGKGRTGLILAKAMSPISDHEVRFDRPVTLADLMRGQRYTYRHHVGDGLWAHTLKDLPGVGIRFRREKPRPTEEVDGRSLYLSVLLSVSK